MKIFNVLAIPLALGLMLVSIYFSVGLLSHFATTDTEYYVYSFAAILFQVSMSVLWVIAHYYKDKNLMQSISAFVGWAILLIISLVGTIGAFSVSTSRSERDIVSDEMKDLKQRIKRINKEIIFYNKELRYGRQQRLLTTIVKPTRITLKKLHAKQDKLEKELADLIKKPPVDKFFQQIAIFSGVNPPEKIKMWIFILVAISVDLTQFVMLKYALDAGMFGGGGKGKIT